MDKKENIQLKKELKRTKDDLEDLEIYIGDFLSFLPLAVCTINPSGIIIDANKALEGLTGFKSIELVGEPQEIIFLEKQKIENLESRIVKERIIRGLKLTLVSKEKKEIPVSVSVSARVDREKNFIGYFLAIFDITETKKTQEELEKKVMERTKELESSRMALMNILEDIEEARKHAEEEKEKTLTIISNFTDGLLVFDNEEKISLINPQAETFFKVKEGDVIGKSILELNSFPKFKPLADLLGQSIEKIYRKELVISENLILEVSTIPIRSKGGAFGSLVIAHDITREKLVEKMKTEFVSLAAHQLRTPLSAIKWTLKMLIEGDLGKLTSEQKDFLEKTYKSNERMINLINDLLDVTRIEEGRYLYKLTLADLENIVQFVINSSQETIRRKKIQLNFKKLTTKIPKISLDVEKIKIVIQNLFDNAIKYTSQKGKIDVSLKYNKKKKEIEFQIEDNGVGIPDDQKERVFTKFFRGSNVMRLDTEGSGLGLFIAKNIIEAHGGSIGFKPKKEKGTIFFFSLPVGEEFSEFLKKF